MSTEGSDSFSLDNFEGSLDFLLSLINKEEIDIYDVPIQELTQQFLLRLTDWSLGQVDKGAEFIGTAAYLVWLKSKTLLPKYNPLEDALLEEEDPHFEIIYHLLDYCRFKRLTQELSSQQDEQNKCFFRPPPSHLEWKKPMGIQHLTLEDLSRLFKDLMNRPSMRKPQIYEENWKVSDKIKDIRSLFQNQAGFALELLFTQEKSRGENIVLFLALLELMKIGEVEVGINQENILYCFQVSTGSSLFAISKSIG